MSTCTQSQPTYAADAAASLTVEFIGVEMSRQTGRSGCGSCDDARSRLAKAVELSKPLFQALGVVPEIVDRWVTNEREARMHRVAASPTIRVGGIEARPHHRDASEAGRVWSWRGEDHSQPPVGMLVDALIRGYAAQRTSEPLASGDISPYLRQFFMPDGATSTAEPAACGCK